MSNPLTVNALAFNRTDRMMAIIALIQFRKFVPARSMAERLSVSERTVYRDLRAIQEIGVPIGFEKDKGYFILGGYFLPPVSLTVEEANALALIAPIMQRFADRSIQEHYDAALDKIKQVLTAEQRRRLENRPSG